ncbi:hypothetical protein C8R47DRAFT_146138 [Mycena vitilis]|nr:hypothetical protein C8R47DRAFT_146138 [Mycena vitilis]
MLVCQMPKRITPRNLFPPELPSATLTSAVANNLNGLASTSRLPFSSVNGFYREEAYVLAAQELKDKVVSVSPQCFLDEHLPATSLELPPVDFAALESVSNLGVERNMYSPLITLLTPFVKEGWHFVDTSDSPDPDSAFIMDLQIKPDITLYADAAASNENVCRATDMELFVEIKTEPLDDPFSDTGDFEVSSAAARDSRGQLITYLNAMQASRYRTHSFGVIIVRNKCRLLRLTRSGLEATTAFDCTKTDFLHVFLWRLSHGSEAVRGFDDTFEPVPRDTDPGVRSMLEVPPTAPLWKVTVSDRSFYVSAPFTRSHHSPFGRGTRCFVAVDCATRHKCVLKDTWRVMKYHPEGEVYERLHQHEVRNIPSVLACGDVLHHHCGRFPGYWKVPPSSIIREQVHYRIVLDVVGRPVENFPSTYALVRYVLDALEAHYDAVTKAQVEHRDVSVGNIIIVDRTDGTSAAYLIDWELACYSEESASRAYDTVGTRQFKSASLCNPDPPVRSLGDEIESFVLVLLWLATSYAPATMTAESRTNALKVFDNYYGLGKIHMLSAGEGIAVMIGLQSEDFERLLADVLEGFSFRYRLLPRMASAAKRAELDKKRLLTENHEWLMQTLQAGLENKNWAVFADPGAAQEVEEPRFQKAKRRKSKLTEYEAGFPARKKWRMY